MIPRVDVDDVFGLPVFGLCLAVAVCGGIVATLTLARLRDLDIAELKGFIAAVLLPGFVVAHVGDLLLYHGSEVVARPALLLDVRSGLSSFCGFFGAVVGALWFHRPSRSQTRTQSMAQQLDLLALVFPVAWLFGRLGCALIHDHPGVVVDADSVLYVVSVGFGDGPAARFGPVRLTWGETPRLDLGLIELVLCLPIAAWCIARWPRPADPARDLDGTTTSTLCLVYGPLRVVLDALRAVDDVAGADVRFAGVTWGQLAGLLVFGLGLWLRRRRRQS